MSAFQEVPVKNLVPSKLNYRQHMDAAALTELTASIKSKGVIQPILVRPLNGKQKGKYEIVAGHRRHQAAEAAGIKQVPAMVRELSDEEALEVNVIENTQREDPNPMDEALGFKRLLEMGKHTPETLAAKLDRSVGYVLSRVKLADLDKKVQDAIATEKIGPGHAVLFTRLKNPGDQQEFLKAILDDDMSVRDAKNEMGDYLYHLAGAPFDTSRCATCFYRSSNQAALFPDLKKTDECTDRSCYETKAKQHYLNLLNEKKKAGFKVFTDEKEIKKLIEKGKASARIVPEISQERTYSGIFFPKRYKAECAKCLEHHAFFLVEEKNWQGRKEYTFGEICLNRPCFDAMNKAAKKEEKAASGYDASGSNPHTLRIKAKDCRDRFLLKALDPKVDQSLALKQRLAIHHIISHFTIRDSSWRDSFIKEYNREYKGAGLYYSNDKVYRGIAGIPADRLDAALFALVFKTFPMTDHDVMLQMTPEAGIDMARDFEMDEEYLKGKTKDELKALAMEIWPKEMPEAVDAVAIAKSTGKKGDIIKAFLAQDLVGKLPKAVAEVSRLDVKDEDDGTEPVGNWCDECGKSPCECGSGSASHEANIWDKAVKLGAQSELDPSMPQPTATGKGKKKGKRARA